MAITEQAFLTKRPSLLWIFKRESSSPLKGEKPKFLRLSSNSLLTLCILFATAWFSSESHADSEELITFNIPQQRADLALTQFAEQANRTFVFPYDGVRNETTSPLVGTYRLEEAIQRLLEGTSLVPELSEEGVLTITTGVDRMNLKKQTGLLAMLSALIGATGGEVIAQDVETSSNRALEEMVVTAQKREQSLQDVPVTVNALSRETLEAQGVDTLFEIADLVPGMVFSRAPDDGLSLTLRGLGTPARTQSFDQSVALFLDGMFVGKGRMYSSSFFDVERLEVIKGTQSTLLGKNTSLGAISIVTRKPGDEFGGDVKVSTEFENGGLGLDAGLDIPLSDTLAVRLATHYADQDGWVKNVVTGQDVPADEDLGVRATAVFTPTDEFDATLTYQHSTSERSGNGFQFIDNGGFFDGNAAALGQLGETVLDDTKTAICPECPGGESFHDTEVDSTALTLNYSLGEHTITSVSSYATYDLKFFDDFDFGAAFDEVTFLLGSGEIEPYSTYFERDEDYDQFSQELRLTSPAGEQVEYLAGLFYFKDDWNSSEQQNWSTPNFPPDPAIQGELFNGPFTNNFSQETETISLFAQLTYNFSDRVRSTLGLRYTDESKDVVFERVQGTPATINNTLDNPPFAPTPLEFNDDFVNGNFNVQFDATENTMLYVSYGLGSKTGGFAESAQIVTADPSLSVDDGGARVETETATTYEAGAKMSLAGGAAELNVALFRTDVDDFQETSFVVTGGPPRFQTRNIDARSEGIEIDGQWQITNDFRLTGGFTHADSTNVDANYTIAQAPKVTGSLGFFLEKEIGDLFFTTNATARYRDDMFSQINNTFASDSLTTFDLIFSLSNMDDTWKVSLVGTNITDEVAADFSGPPAAPIGAIFGAPAGEDGITAEAPSTLRTISLQASFNF